MVGLNRVATDNIEDADDQEEAEYACPPRELGEWVVWCFLDLADDAPDNGDEPRKLKRNRSAVALTILTQGLLVVKGGGREETHKTD